PQQQHKARPRRLASPPLGKALWSKLWVWLDFWSVPQAKEHQAERSAAISSIPHFAISSAFMLVLCPKAHHAKTAEPCDFESWERRGWCRLERLAFSLSHYSVGTPPPMYVVDGSGHFERATTMRFSIASQSVFNGEVIFPPLFHTCAEIVARFEILAFSPLQTIHICTTMSNKKHSLHPSIPQFTVESDRDRLTPVVKTIYDQACMASKAKGDLSAWRKLLAIGDVWFDGSINCPFCVHDENPSSIDGFLAKYEFSRVNERGAAGMTPLHYAAYENNVSVIHKLVAAGADLEARDDAQFPIGGGCTPFFLAVALGRYEAVDALLELRADVFNSSTEAPSITHILVLPGEDFSGPNSDKILSRILASGVDVDHQIAYCPQSGVPIKSASKVSLNGTSMLFVAAHGNDLAKIQLLLEYSANPMLRYLVPSEKGGSGRDDCGDVGDAYDVSHLPAAPSLRPFTS
ncbi:MAG: hypothetical protein SGPRY_014269, partial [Prymnesium sp.]